MRPQRTSGQRAMRRVRTVFEGDSAIFHIDREQHALRQGAPVQRKVAVAGSRYTPSHGTAMQSARTSYRISLLDISDIVLPTKSPAMLGGYGRVASGKAPSR
jgi:hypothetical protein